MTTTKNPAAVALGKIRSAAKAKASRQNGKLGGRPKKANMNNQIGIDHTGNWTPAQYAIDAGWDYSCVEATAKKGVSEADAEGLTKDQRAALLAFCRVRVFEEKRWAKKGTK